MCLFLPDYGPFGRRGVRRDAVSLSRIRVRVSFTTGAVQSAILATAGLLVHICGVLHHPSASAELLVSSAVNTNATTIQHSFNGLFSRTTQESWHQKSRTILVKPIWIYWSEIVSGSGISWAICKSAPRFKQIPCQHPTTTVQSAVLLSHIVCLSICL